MIKLFWNTHNQKKPNSENKKLEKKRNQIMDGANTMKKAQTNGFIKFLKKLSIILLTV